MSEVELGNRRELFEISSKTTETVYLTTGDSVFVTEAHTYSPGSIKRTAFSLSSDLTTPTVTITAPPLESLLRYLSNFPVSPTQVKISTVKDDDTISTLFIGKVTNVSILGNVCSAECSAGSDLLQTKVPSYIHSAFCQNTLFDAKCGLSSGDYKVSTVVAVFSTYLQASVFATEDDGYFSGGYVETVENDFRYIVYHEGDKIYLQAGFSSDVVSSGTLVSVYPGCDGNYDTCNDVFDNVKPAPGKGFNGCRNIPISNPVVWGFKPITAPSH